MELYESLTASLETKVKGQLAKQSWNRKLNS
jgi:hypothetical protein